MTAGWQAKGADSFVYRVTREKAESCYARNDSCKHEVSELSYRHWNGQEWFYHWFRTTKICSKRSALMQASHLIKKDGTQRYPHERLISVERAPYQVFEDITSDVIKHVEGYVE